MPKSILPLYLSVTLLATPAFGAPGAAPPAAKGAPATTAPDPAVGNALFQQAIAATKAGKATEAEVLYGKLLALFPNVAPAWANRGLLRAQTNRLDAAAADMRKAVQLEPKTAPFWSQLASIELRRKNIKAAESAARKALALDPENVYGLADLSGALLQQNRYTEAIGPLKRLVAVTKGRDPQAALSLTVALVRSQRLKEALPVAKQLVEQFPDTANYQLMLGDIAAQNGDYATAQKAYGRVYALVPTDVRAGINVAVAAEMAKQPDAAKAQIERVIAAHPREPLAYFQLGRLYYLYPQLARGGAPLENFSRAADNFRQAMLLDPKNPLYLSNLGLALMFQGDEHSDEATKFFQIALNVAPKDTVAHMGLAYLAEKQKRPAEAIVQYRAILAYAPTLYDPRRRLAGLLYATGQKEASYTEFRTLATQTPGPQGVTVLEELASLLMNDHRYAEAKEAYSQAVQRNPADSAAMVGMGQALEFLKQPDAAKKQYAAAIAVSPKNATAYAALGLLLQNEHKIAEATAVYERFVAADPTNNDAHWQLAQLYEDQKRDDDALREMHKLTLRKNDPTHLAYLMGPAGLLAKRGRYDDAVTELQRVIVENPTDATELRYSLAAVQEQAGKAADAEKTLTALAQAAKQPDEQARANTALAQFFEKESRWEQAALAYEDVLRDNPGSNPARIGLWRVRDKQKQPAAAATFLESLALAGADNPNLAAVTSVGLLYQQVGTPEKYVEFTRRLSEKYAKSRGALNVYALALLQGVGSPQEKERRAAAADVYRQMIALDARDADAFYQLAIQEEALGQKEPAIAAYRSAAAITSGEPASVTAAQSARAALKRLGVAESAAAPTATPQTAPTSAPAPAGNRTGPDVPKSGS